MASIRKQPQENLLVLLTDESDKPLNILRHSIGKKDETIVDPSIVIGHAARVPKARNMWLVHNHPSGLSTLSGADVNMSKTMARLLDGSGIRYQGLMAVGRDRFSHVDARGHIVQERVRPVLRSRQIPVVERAFVRRGTLGAVITPQNVVDIAAKVSGGKDGVMLLDTQLQPTAFLPMTANEMGKLRGTGGLEKLLSGVEKSNASMAITVVHETESAAQARNLNSALEASGIRVLDIVASGKPLTQVGQALRRTGNTPFESRQPRPSAGVSASAAGKAAAQFMSKLPGAARLKVIVVRSLKDIPEESKPSDMAEGVYYPAGDEGRIYLVADNLTTMLRLRQVLAHEVVGHFGVEALLGHQFDGVLADVRRLARVPRGQHATGDEELGDANYATMEAVGMRYSDYDAKARAREVLARMAEEGRFRTFLATVYAKIRKALRALGFDLKLTTADLRQMVIDAGKFLRTAPAGQAFARTRAAAASMAASEGGTEPRTVTQQAQREERQTERAYGGRPTYDRARAAGRTKLNYQQWVQVRTPAFKQWFGDWEAVRAQQRLDAMKPVTVRVPDEWRGLSHSELRQRMAESLDRMVRDRTEIEHPEIGLIRVGRAGAKKSTGSARDPAKSLVVADIGALIPKTIYARSEHSSGGDGPDIAGYSTLLARVSVDEVPMVAAFTVRHQSDGKWYYNAATLHDADKKARDSYGRPDHRSGSSFAPISGLEDFIRRPLVRVNPTDVSEAVDPGTGEPLVVYHGTYEDFTTFETGHPGSVGDSPSNAFYFTPDPTVAKMYVPGGDVMQVYLSAENPLDLRTPEGLAALNSAIEDGEVSGPLYGLKPSKGFKKGNLWDQIMEMEPKEPNDLLNGIADWARDNGYGGLVFRDVIEGNEADSYAVFSPEQIKSATGNRGTFSSDSANITESRRDDAPVDLPDAIVGRALGDASKHPDYAAAKAGDTEAAARLVNDLVTPEMITKVRDALGDKKPIVVPVLAIESTGQNKIPLAVAHRVAAAFGLDVDYGIFQSVKAGRTSLTGLDRIFQQPEFDGTVRAGQQYLLVDDTLTQGGTMAALASHIRQHGGDVAGVFALTGKQYSATLRLSHDTLKTLRERYGDIENEFRAATGRGFDSLTESEGRYLATHGAPDVIRARILAEGHARSGGVLQKTLGPEDDRLIAQQSDTKAPPSAGLSSDGPRESRARGNSTARTQKMMRDRALHESGIFAEKETIKARFNRLTENARAKAIQGLFDHFYSLKSLDETAYMQARLSRGHEGAAEYLVRFGPVILRQGAIDGVRGKGLAEILADLDGEHDHFMAWIAGNRAERLMSEGRENLFDVETIARFKTFNTGKMSDGRDRGPVYAQALKELNVLQKSVLDVAEKAGLINRESRMLWEHEFYVPFYRAMESDSTGMMGPGQIGGLVGQYAFKRLKGGKEKLNDLVGNTIANWSHLISASMKNLAAQKAIEAARSMGIATHVNHPTKNGVRIMFDGLDRYFVVDDPMVLESLTALHWNGFGGPAWEAMKKARHALTMGVTLSPTFRIRNLLRDTLQALAIESNISVNPVMNLAVGWEATKSGSDTMQRLLAGGGAIRFGSFNDGNARNVKRLVDELQIDRNQVVTSPRQLIRLLKASFDWYQELGDRGETVNRAAIYEAARKNGKSHLEASYLARDLMDFSSVGSWASIRMLAQTVSFMNARMQGMYRLGRSAHENFPRFAAVTGVMALATIGLYLVMRDDKDYKELPDWARNTYWAFKIPGIDRMFFIPKPFEVGALATVLERGAELAFSGEDYRLGDFAQSTRGVIEDQLSMNPIP